MDIVNIIKQRRSTRTFNSKSLDKSVKAKLQAYINENNKGINEISIDFNITEKTESDIQMKIPYGLIKGNKTYIYGQIKSDHISRINYGYQLEKIVLKATELNISTCWVGMFDREYFSVTKIEQGYTIPGIVVIGYSELKIPVKEKIIRKAVNANKRKPWETLFFDYDSNQSLNPENVAEYIESLELTRLSPSSGNTQPWRIFHDKKTNDFHFYKKITNKNYEQKGMHDIDMGIAMSHFELVSEKNGLKGNWIIQSKENIKSIEELQYIITWKSKNQL